MNLAGETQITEVLTTQTLSIEATEGVTTQKFGLQHTLTPANTIGTQFSQAERFFSVGAFDFPVPYFSWQYFPIRMGSYTDHDYCWSDDPFYLQPFLQQFMTMYKYMSWKSITFRVEMESVPFTYGAMSVVSLPWHYDGLIGSIAGTGSFIFDRWSLYAYSPITFNIADQQIFEFEVPYTSPFQFLDCYLGAGIDMKSILWSFPTLIFSNLTYLYQVNVDITSEVKFRIYAKFNGLQFYCPIWDPEEINKRKRGRKLDKGDACMLPTTVHDLAPSATVGGTLLGVASAAVGTLSNMVSPGITAAAGAAAAHFTGTGTQAAIGGVQQSIDKLNETIVQDSKQDMAEANAQATINPYPPDFQMARTGNIAHIMPYGFDTVVNPSQFHDVTSKHGIYDLCKKPGLFAQAGLSNDSPYAGFNLYPFYNNAWQPNWGNTRGYTYMLWFSQFYAYWRGSLNFMIQFFGSPFISARVQLTITYGGQIIDYRAGSLKPTFPTKDITIKGDVVEKFSIPYFYMSDWAPTMMDGSANLAIDAQSIPQLNLTLLSLQSAGTSLALSVPYVIWVAAGDDFQFRFPQVASYGKVRGLDSGDACCDIAAEFRSGFMPFPGMTGGNTACRKGEATPMMMEDFINRFSLLEEFSHGVGYEFTPLLPNVSKYNGSTTPSPSFDAGCSVLEMVGTLFMFFSGDMDVSTVYRSVVPDDDPPGKFPGDMGVSSITPRASNGEDIDLIGANTPDNGISYTDIGQWTNSRISMPWVSPFPVGISEQFKHLFAVPVQSEYLGYFFPKQLVTQVQTYNMSPDIYSVIDKVYVRAGKSFQMFGILPLPQWAYWPMNTAIIAPPEHLLVPRGWCKELTEPLRIMRRSKKDQELRRRLIAYKMRASPPSLSQNKKKNSNGKDKDKSACSYPF